MKAAFIALFFLTLFSARAFTQTKDPIDVKMDACIETAYSTHEMLSCYNTAHQEWDARLNEQYKQLMEILPEKGKNLLKKAELKWIAFKEAENELQEYFYTEILEGTMYQPILSHSELEITKQRTLQIQEYLDQSHGR